MNINVGLLRSVKDSIFAATVTLKKQIEGDSLISQDEAKKIAGVFSMIGLPLMVKLFGDIKIAIEKINNKECQIPEAKKQLYVLIEGVENYINAIIEVGINRPVGMFDAYKKLKLEIDGKANSYKEIDIFFPDLTLAEQKFIENKNLNIEQLKIKSTDSINRAKQFIAKLSTPSMPERASAMEDLVKCLNSLIDFKYKKEFFYYLKCVRAFLDIVKVENLITKEEYIPYISLIIKGFLSELPQYAERKTPGYDRFKETLFYIGKIKTNSQEALEIIDFFNLKDFMNLNPINLSMTSDSSSPQVDYKVIDSVTKELTDILAQLKAEWNNKIATAPVQVKDFIAVCNAISNKIEMLPLKSSKKISNSFKELATKMMSLSAPPNEILSQEVAYMAVLLDLVVERKCKLSQQFEGVLELQSKRLSAAIKNDLGVLSSLQLPLVDEETRDGIVVAANKATVDEMQKVLEHTQELMENFIKAHVEGKLTPTEIESLKIIKSEWNTVRKILNIMRFKDAERLFNYSLKVLDDMISKNSPPSDDVLELLTTAVGGVNYFFESFKNEDGRTNVILKPIVSKVFNEPIGKEVIEEDSKNEDPILIAESVPEPIKNDDLLEFTPSIKLDGQKQQSPEPDSLIFTPSPPSLPDEVNIPTNQPLSIPQEVDKETNIAVSDAGMQDDGVVDSVPEHVMDLMDVFIEECEDIYTKLRKLVSDYKTTSKYDIVLAKRSFHTLKGSCNMLEVLNFGACCADVENFLVKVDDNKKSLASNDISIVDTISGVFETWFLDIKHKNCAFIDANKINNYLYELDMSVFGSSNRNIIKPTNISIPSVSMPTPQAIDNEGLNTQSPQLHLDGGGLSVTLDEEKTPHIDFVPTLPTEVAKSETTDVHIEAPYIGLDQKDKINIDQPNIKPNVVLGDSAAGTQEIHAVLSVFSKELATMRNSIMAMESVVNDLMKKIEKK